MNTSERPTVVIDIAAKWAVDAALLLVMAAGFLLWGVTVRNATGNILSWAIMATVALLLDRLLPLLPGTGGLADARERPPDGAVRLTVGRYAAEAACATVLLTAVYAAFVVYLAPPGFMAGLLTAYCVSRVRAALAARAIERASGVRLSARVQRFIWRRQTPTYYATPRPV